ncbi:MAG: MotA/TolQ/ExbB proton channel family protein [Verrucomicrobia bacterium]|nr:MotA/TolQ/ExbB proton channel family protein [Verrucomicrobiota bacterium]
MNAFINDLVSLLVNGGWLMIPLAALSCVIYYAVADLYFQLKDQKSSINDEDSWIHWLEKPSDAKGDLKDIFEFTQSNISSVDDIKSRFGEVKMAHLPYLDQKIRYLLIIVSAAPLTGLLGTVTGMLSTFAGLSGGSGETIDLVAGGISEALITTETGLVLAIPAYVLVSRIKRMRDEFEHFLRKAETLTLKKFASSINL